MNETIVEPEMKKQGIFKNQPVSLVAAIILLLLLVVVFAILPLTGVERSFFRPGVAGINRGQFTNRANPGNFQGAPNFNSDQFPQGLNNNSANGQNDQAFNNTRQFNANSGIAQVGRILTNILHWIFIAVGAAGIAGLWLKKRWGVVLAILLAVIAFVFTVPSLFRPMFSTYLIVTNIVTLVLSVGVIVLSLLPQTRRATAPAV